MKPPRLGYLAASSVTEALEVLDALGDEAKALAGGQSLVPLLNMRLVRPVWLLDLNRVAELSGIQPTDGGYTIGAMTRQRHVENHAGLGRDLPIVRCAVRNIGHPQIRNRGTVGGSLAHADPSSELSLLAILLDAQMRISCLQHGSRTVAAGRFFSGYLTTILGPTELLTQISIPALPRGTGWGFLEVARRHGDFALVSAAATLRLDADGHIAEARIAVGGAHAFPVRLNAAEALLRGGPPDARSFTDAAGTGVESLDPDADIHASSEYRRRVAAKLVSDVLQAALERARASV